ncbi:MAG: lipocalin-like domain-containing protein [Rhodopila sp.]
MLRKLTMMMTLPLVIGSAVAQTGTSLQLTGTYMLTSIYDELSDGRKNDTWGSDPKGVAMFSPYGMFAVQIYEGERQKAPDKAARDPIGPLVAYYGTYHVDDGGKTVTYQIQQSSFPGWNGLERRINIEQPNADTLRMTAPVKGDPKLGDFTTHVEWRRVSGHDH